MSHDVRTRLSAIRREFHRHPEPSWCEIQTTARIVEELSRIGVDRVAIGRDALASDHRMAVPSEETLAEWHDRAAAAGVDDDVLAATADGHTGCVAVVELGEGPTVGLRVDMDAVSMVESDEPGHRPADEGFRSETAGYMHACGHDAHAAIGLGVVEAVKASDFSGTFKCFFQPAEEVAGGGKPMAESGHVDDVEYLFACHLGLGYPTGTVVASATEPLAMAHLTATFEGAAAHAGKDPSGGTNAMQAMATGVQNAYGIARHGDGMTRVNFGRVAGGSASNVIAEEITLDGEVRGETTALMEYTRSELERILYAAAEVHGCDVVIRRISESIRVDSDPVLGALVADVARGVDGVDSVVPEAPLGASEDVTFLMKHVHDRGGRAAYVIVGGDHPTSHQTPTFDVDERSLGVAVELLSSAIVNVGANRP
ncbi:amidohydrolase [Halorubrum vacuolatum]|uniref:Aminobenzoyl-glutamate utilization protein A n=1 Tax=Halorubrum vacuolatum TaxID=63740 RepID=A0A238V8Q9_HALVU|nr:amidohydrolase [Halorubrum vacuolatum]SNR30795.1 aminobenzoyl-glutamate utilization protein A [Halorubrum vacuolatum]